MNRRCKDALSLRDHLNRSCQLLPPAPTADKDVLHSGKDGQVAHAGNENGNGSLPRRIQMESLLQRL